MAEQVTSTIHSTFRGEDVVYDIVVTQKKGDGTTLARNATKEGYTHVVAAGGDGTINEVATGLVGSSTVLCIIPVGSGNGLARGLRIPLHYQHACNLILHGTPKTIDVGQVCDRYFFVTSGIGFDAHVGKCYNEKSGHSRGMLPYFQLAVTEYFKYTPQKITLYCNGQSFTYTPFVLTVANVEQYGGGAIIAPGALPDDGFFDISIIPQTHFLRIIQHLPKLFSGEIDTTPYFITHRTASLTIMRPSSGPVHVDGESFVAGEVLEYRLLPHALHVQAPNAPVVSETPRKETEIPPEDVFGLLEKLARLQERGVITEDEFKEQKKKLLGRLSSS